MDADQLLRIFWRVLLVVLLYAVLRVIHHPGTISTHGSFSVKVPLDGFMIRFNKNTFGLAAGGQLQVPQLLPGTSASTLVPMVLFQNISPGPPDTLLQVAFKNNEQPVWYFNDKIYFLVLFTEDGRMEHSTFLEINRVLQDVQLDDQKRFKQFDSQRRARMEVYLESWNNGGVLRIYHLRKFGAS